MNKLIEQLVNKLELARKINELSLNKLSSFVISSSLSRVRNKIKRTKLKHCILGSTQLNYIPKHNP
jgi:hypothetical protein